MKLNAFARAVGAVVVGVLALAGCSISIGSASGGSSPHATAAALAAPASPSSSQAGANYLAFVGPANTATFALDTAVLGSTGNLTPLQLSSVIAASAASLQTFDDHLRSATWPRTAEPDITALAATNDVLVAVLQGYEADLRSPRSGADFDSVLKALQADDSAYAIDRGLASDHAAHVRSDIGLPPASAPQVTLND